MSESGTRVRRQLPSHPSSAGEARRMVGRVLAEAGRDDLLEQAQLLVSEVVTNALVHSATPIDVSMAATADGVLVEVGDGSEHVPRRRHYALTASTGRGLALLENTAHAWGVVPGVRGKTVWFELSTADLAENGAGGDAPDTPDAVVVPLRRTDDTVTVRLLNMPLLLHTAWQQHAQAVLREYLMARMGADAGDDPFTVHAVATDALSMLTEQIPAAEVGVRADEVMDAAVEARVSHPCVELQLPRAGVPRFDVLEATLDAAHRLAEAEQLLVPKMQPEMRLLRQWLCRQVTSQADGAAATRWPPRESLTPPHPRPVEWDSSPVAESALAMVAADDTGLIVAVSAPAVALLGYDAAEELLGRRLITIIPRRYRQAHLAGFTLHLLTGRGPLLDETVRVPALRRDESETTVELSVAVQRAPGGRSVFVARLHEAGADPPY